MNIHQARAVLRRHGFSAKKSLGQNFLVDTAVLDQIVQAAEIGPDSTVLEIGPGLGVLTNELALRAGRVIAVEIDQRMVEILGETLTGLKNVQVVQADILATNPASLAGEEYLVVANLPYYITSLTLRHLLESSPPPRRLVVMVQKEVAERIVARPPKMSLLAVSVQIYGSPSLVGIVPPASFYPAPDVDSAILRVDVHERPIVPTERRERFFEIVSAGFSQPRKQLHNTLAQRLWFPPGGAAAALDQAGIDPSRRAGTLSIVEWVRLADIIDGGAQSELRE